MYFKKNPFKKGDIVKHRNPSIRGNFKVVKVMNSDIKLIVCSTLSTFGTFPAEDFILVEEAK